MFLFEVQEDAAEPGVWIMLHQRLPDEYAIPDIPFLRCLHPTIDPALVKTKDWLIPDQIKWEAFMQTILPGMPEGYGIPDIPFLKRMFEAGYNG
jgi:hypothetical protein